MNRFVGHFSRSICISRLVFHSSTSELCRLTFSLHPTHNPCSFPVTLPVLIYTRSNKWHPHLVRAFMLSHAHFQAYNTMWTVIPSLDPCFLAGCFAEVTRSPLRLGPGPGWNRPGRYISRQLEVSKQSSRPHPQQVRRGTELMWWLSSVALRGVGGTVLYMTGKGITVLGIVNIDALMYISQVHSDTHRALYGASWAT